MNRNLNVAEYAPTESFKNIPAHTAVCFDDMTLVAVTGPAGDKESQAYARLFAAAPELLGVLMRAEMNTSCSMVIAECKTGECWHVAARAAIARARMVTPI